MSRTTKVVLIVVACVALVFGTTATWAAVTVYRAGSVSVQVEDLSRHGNDVSLRVPGILFTLAAHLAPLPIPEEAASEVRPHLPVMRAVSREIDELPDAVFVAVDSRDEHVRIAKQDGHLVVRVHTPTERVEVRVPLRAARTVVARLDRAVRKAG